MMLTGLPVPDNAVADLAEIDRAVGADDLADRLERRSVVNRAPMPVIRSGLTGLVR